jgi:phospholipid/cholesterol/gamma-HCH transport system substrate-binding protein
MSLKISREYKIGFTFIVAMGLFIWGFNYLKGKDVFNRETHYYVVYETVTGLAKSSPVFINGLRVGTVNGVTILPQKGYPILVDFAVSSKIRIPENSAVWIYSADLLGSKALDIRLGNSTKDAAPEDTLKGLIQTSLQEELGARIEPIKDKAEALMGSIDSAMMVIRLIFNERTRQNLESSFASVKNTLQNLERITLNADVLLGTQKDRLATILGNVESISSNIRNNNQNLSNIITNFSNLSDTIAAANVAKTIYDLNSSLRETSVLLTKMNKGEGTAGKLLTDDSLYNALTSSSAQLDLLLEDMRLHPKRYVHFSVFGKKDKTLSAPAEKK